jgi:hypothetical protein
MSGETAGINGFPHPVHTRAQSITPNAGSKRRVGEPTASFLPLGQTETITIGKGMNVRWRSCTSDQKAELFHYRDQTFPVFVIFFEGLMGPGGFVWAGNSSPWA